MVGIKRETDYAVRIVLHLASVGEKELVQVRDVAEQRALPLSFVRRIVARLNAAGILASTRGMGGGIRLARPAAEISLLEVVDAMEDGVALNRCLEPDHQCPFSSRCPAQAVWADVTVILETHMASVRFDALAQSSRRHVKAHRSAQARSRRR